MPIVHQLNDTIYCRDVYLVVGTRKDLRNYLIQEWGKQAAATIPRRTSAAVITASVPAVGGRTRAYIYVVWLADWDGSPTAYGTLSHECYHAVVAVFEELGIELEQEAVAYYLESMVRQFAEALEK